MPVTLKKRSEFLRIRGGSRWSTPSFVLETKPRPAAVPDAIRSGSAASDMANSRTDATAGTPPPRFGFTVTKQLGNAVVRNRIRRRLKSAIDLLAETSARPGYDYVLIARLPALTRPFADLKKELEDALHRVHHAPQRRPKPRGS